MPVLTRRGSLGNLRRSVEETIYKSSESMDLVHIMEDDGDKAGVVEFSGNKSKASPPLINTNLYLSDHTDLHTGLGTDLHDRYESSEEETSPSSEDYTSSVEESLEVLSAAEEAEDEEDNDFDIPSDWDDDESAKVHDVIISAIAVAIPLFSAGLPRLIDITRDAPMQKRRAPPAVPAYSAKRFSVVHANAGLTPTRHFSIPTRSTSVSSNGSRYLTREPSPLATNTPITASLDSAEASSTDGIDEAELLMLESEIIQGHYLDMADWHTDDGGTPATAPTIRDDTTDTSSLGNTSASNAESARSFETDNSSLDVPPEADLEAFAIDFEYPGISRRGSAWVERGWRGLGKRMLAGVDLGTRRKRGKISMD